MNGIRVQFATVFAGFFVITIGASGILRVLTDVTLISGERLAEIVGERQPTLVSRLMDPMLAVIGARTVFEGIQGAIKPTP